MYWIVFFLLGMTSRVPFATAEPHLAKPHELRLKRGESLDDAIKRIFFECERGECSIPEASGVLVSLSSLFPGQEQRHLKICNGSLVGQSKWGITNAHCLSPHILSQKENCSNQVALVFPRQKGSGIEVVRCKKIWLKSDWPDGFMGVPMVQSDYAVFEVESTKRKALPFSRGFLNSNQSLEVLNWTPVFLSDGRIRALESRLRARVKMGSLLHSQFLTSNHSTALGLIIEGHGTLKNVDLGHSGSVIQDASGQVVGVLQSRLTEGFEWKLKSRDWLQNFNLGAVQFEWPVKAPAHFYFTQTRCLMSNSNLCKEDKWHLQFQNLKMEVYKILQANRQTWIDSLLSSLRDVPFEYEVFEDRDSTFRVKPRCLKDPSIWKSKLRLLENHGYLNWKARVYETEVLPTTLKLSVRVSLNSEFVPTTMVLEPEIERSQFRFYSFAQNWAFEKRVFQSLSSSEPTYVLLDESIQKFRNLTSPLPVCQK